jgi:gamma-glutamyl-gamma-aminobutyrate hydrolase PuuD
MAKTAREIFIESGLLVRKMNGIDGQTLGQLILVTALKLHQRVRELMRNEKSQELREAVNDAVDDLQGVLLLVPDYLNEANRLAVIGRNLNKIITRGGKNAKPDDGS